MIPRYTREEISKLWTDKHKFITWLRVEIAILEAKEELGLILKGIAQIVKEKTKIDVQKSHIWAKGK